MKLSKTDAERAAEKGTWKRKFAFFPTSLSDGSVIWLERYEYMRTWFIFADKVGWWKHHRRSVAKTVKRGTSSGGPGAPTSSGRNNVHKGGLG